MEIKDRKACVIFENHKKNILLQMRDEDPEIGKWVPFGGSIEKGESEIEAAKREILEELNYKVKDITFFKKYIHNNVEQFVFISHDKIDMREIDLQEGADLQFFSFSELENIDIGFNYKEVLNDYFKNRDVMDT